MNPQKRDRITVIQDDTELEVYNWVNIQQPAVVRGHNPVVERFDTEIGAGDTPVTPDAVTHWVAEALWHEFNISETTLHEKNIDVIDVTSPEVEIV